MTTLLYILIVCEMTAVNLTTLHLCATKKYSTLKTIGVFLGFSVFLIGGIMLLIRNNPYYGNGNGVFVLAGALYLIPASYLYDEKLSFITEVVCSSWIYTMLAFMLSVHFGYLLNSDIFPIVVFTFQTLFYLLTVNAFWKFVRNKFVYILKNIPLATRKYLRYGSICWFLAMVAINVSFVADKNAIAKIIALVFIGIIAWVSYALIYEITISSRSAKKMKQIATTDYLTKLPNRYSLWNDAEAYIQKKSQFSICYLDLDKFKSINDRFGHLSGDLYLSLFAQHAQEAISSNGTLYRISGDEFIILCPIEFTTTIENTMSKLHFKNDEFGNFLGISMGVAQFPTDGDNFDILLSIADQAMYNNKINK